MKQAHLISAAPAEVLTQQRFTAVTMEIQVRQVSELHYPSLHGSPTNLVPIVLRLYGQRLVPRRLTLRNCNFFHGRISVIKQCKPLRDIQSKIIYFFEFSRAPHWDQPLAKEPEDSVYKIGLQLKMLNAAVFASKSESYSYLLANFKELNLAFKNVVLKLSTEHRWCIKN